jgi:hypothetical protein
MAIAKQTPVLFFTVMVAEVLLEEVDVTNTDSLTPLLWHIAPPVAVCW